jgi:hypothetical protein
MRTRVHHPVGGVEAAPATSTLRIRTRLAVSDTDRVVLSALGVFFEHLVDQDLAARCKAGADHDKHAWARRKQILTAECSSRWAGRITRASNNAYATARRNQRRELADKTKAINAITAKLDLPVRSADQRKEMLAAERAAAKAEGRAPRQLAFGYRSIIEHWNKRRRLQSLVDSAERLEADISSGRVRICRGGRGLARTRLHLDAAGIDEAAWRRRWEAKRRSFGADGEAGKSFGNETIRVSPAGVVEINLPPALRSLANTPAGRYRLDARAVFAYRRDEWSAQVAANRAVAYDVCCDESGKVYFDASFTLQARPEVSTFEELQADPGLRVVAVDLNHGFLAPAVLDRSGNPIACPSHIPLLTEDLPASTRDGHLRQALSDLLDLAEAYKAKLIVVENLGFADMRATGRETYGSAKWFRKIVCSIPTRDFRDRLVAMASRRGMTVAGVPAAYSSIWGAAYWQAPTSSENLKTSRHTAAAVVLGRRALGHSARRRCQATPGSSVPDQRIEAAGAPKSAIGTASTDNVQVSGTGKPSARRSTTRGKPSRREGNRATGCKTHKRRNGTTAGPTRTVRVGNE